MIPQRQTIEAFFQAHLAHFWMFCGKPMWKQKSHPVGQWTWCLLISRVLVWFAFWYSSLFCSQASNWSFGRYLSTCSADVKPLLLLTYFGWHASWLTSYPDLQGDANENYGFCSMTPYPDLHACKFLARAPEDADARFIWLDAYQILWGWVQAWEGLSDSNVFSDDVPADNVVKLVGRCWNGCRIACQTNEKGIVRTVMMLERCRISGVRRRGMSPHQEIRMQVRQHARRHISGTCLCACLKTVRTLLENM